MLEGIIAQKFRRTRMIDSLSIGDDDLVRFAGSFQFRSLSPYLFEVRAKNCFRDPSSELRNTRESYFSRNSTSLVCSYCEIIRMQVFIFNKKCKDTTNTI